MLLCANKLVSSIFLSYARDEYYASLEELVERIRKNTECLIKAGGKDLVKELILIGSSLGILVGTSAALIELAKVMSDDELREFLDHLRAGILKYVKRFDPGLYYRILSLEPKPKIVEIYMRRYESEEKDLITRISHSRLLHKRKSELVKAIYNEDREAISKVFKEMEREGALEVILSLPKKKPISYRLSRFGRIVMYARLAKAILDNEGLIEGANKFVMDVYNASSATEFLKYAAPLIARIAHVAKRKRYVRVGRPEFPIESLKGVQREYRRIVKRVLIGEDVEEFGERAETFKIISGMIEEARRRIQNLDVSFRMGFTKETAERIARLMFSILRLRGPVTFVLDMSGSIYAIRHGLRMQYAFYLIAKRLRERGHEVHLILFDEKIHIRDDLLNKNLTYEEFVSLDYGGATALMDAISFGILATPPGGTIIVSTDEHENASSLFFMIDDFIHGSTNERVYKNKRLILFDVASYAEPTVASTKLEIHTLSAASLRALVASLIIYLLHRELTKRKATDELLRETISNLIRFRKALLDLLRRIPPTPEDVYFYPGPI